MFRKPFSQILKELQTKRGRDALKKDLRSQFEKAKSQAQNSDSFKNMRSNMEQMNSQRGRNHLFQSIRSSFGKFNFGNFNNFKGFKPSGNSGGNMGGFNRFLNNLPRPLHHYIIGANIVMFLLWNTGVFGQNFLLNNFALSLPNIESYRYHTYLTYSLSHVNVLQLLFNMVTFYFFGRFVETYYGARTLLQLWFAGSLVSGMFINSVNQRFQNPMPTVGASGAIASILSFYILTFPQQEIFLFFFPVRAWVLGALLGGYSLLTFSHNQSSAGYLGGMLAGAGLFMQKRGWRF